MDQEESSNVLTLVWEDLEKMPGDVVVVSCAGASSGTTSNNITSAWTTSMSEVGIISNIHKLFSLYHQVMTSVVVPGAGVDDDDSKNDDDMDDDN